MIDISSLQTFTAADLLALCEHNIAQIHVGGQSIGVNGRQLGRADLNDLYKQRAALKAEIDGDTDDGGGIALVQYGERM